MLRHLLCRKKFAAHKQSFCSCGRECVRSAVKLVVHSYDITCIHMGVWWVWPDYGEGPTSVKVRWSFPSESLRVMASLEELCAGLPLNPLPCARPRDPNVPHAPTRACGLNRDEKRVSGEQQLSLDHMLAAGSKQTTKINFAYIVKTCNFLLWRPHCVISTQHACMVPCTHHTYTRSPGSPIRLFNPKLNKRFFEQKEWMQLLHFARMFMYIHV